MNQHLIQAGQRVRYTEVIDFPHTSLTVANDGFVLRLWRDGAALVQFGFAPDQRELIIPSGELEVLPDNGTFPCPWLVDRGRDEDGEQIITECGARARARDDGFDCEAGHEHTDAQSRWEQGWDYAEDGEEARRLAKAGTEPRDIVSGGPFRY